jgi:hypothetical protein
VCIIGVFNRLGTRFHAKYILPLCKAGRLRLAPALIVESFLKLDLIKSWTEPCNIEVRGWSIPCEKELSTVSIVRLIGINGLVILRIPIFGVFGDGSNGIAIKYLSFILLA